MAHCQWSQMSGEASWCKSKKMEFSAKHYVFVLTLSRFQKAVFTTDQVLETRESLHIPTICTRRGCSKFQIQSCWLRQMNTRKYKLIRYARNPCRHLMNKTVSKKLNVIIILLLSNLNKKLPSHTLVNSGFCNGCKFDFPGLQGN